jgi:hypothetical protein
MSTSRDYHPYLIESLKDPTESAAFLEAVLEDCTPEELDLALTDIAAAHTQTDDRLGLMFSHIGHHISLMKQPPSPAMTFSETIEAVKNLSTDEKLEVQQLLNQYLRDDRREDHCEFSIAHLSSLPLDKLRSRYLQNQTGISTISSLN